MGQSFQDLIDQWIAVRDAKYRDDNEEAAARLECIEDTMLTMLEKLRDRLDPR